MLLFVMVTAVETQAQIRYGNNGYHCLNDNTDSSSILVIGDSRCCQMYNYDNESASYVSVWGGHYGYGGSNMQIDHSSASKYAKEYIEKTLVAHGECDVFIFATVNDYNGGNFDKEKNPAGNHIINYAKELSKIEVKRGSTYVKPDVRIVSLVGGFGKDVESFNDELWGLCAETDDIGFLSINETVGEKEDYLGDNLHYSENAILKIYSAIGIYESKSETETIASNKNVYTKNVKSLKYNDGKNKRDERLRLEKTMNKIKP